MNKSKYLLIIVLAITLNATAQSIENPRPTDFYIIDTITIKNPVVIFEPNRSGRLVANYNKLKEIKKFRLKDFIKNDDTYIFGNNPHGYLNYED